MTTEAAGEASYTLTKPDGSPIDASDQPAAGTMLVIEVWDAEARKASVTGWVPQHDTPGKILLRACCRVLHLKRSPQ